MPGEGSGGGEQQMNSTSLRVVIPGPQMQGTGGTLRCGESKRGKGKNNYLVRLSQERAAKLP